MNDDSPSLDTLQHPLDVVLGFEAHVRLLRVLLASPGSVFGVADAARLSGLTPAGARRALERLRAAGFVSRVGSGRALKYRVRDDAVGLRGLTSAFEQERERYDSLIASLKSAVSIPEVASAWLDHSPSEPSASLHIELVVEPGSLGWIQTELRSRLLELEHKFDIIVEIAIHTRADAPVPGVAATMLWGLAPGAVAERSAARTHDGATARALLVSVAIADLIRRDPTLVDRARRHVIRLLSEDQGTATSDLLEWRQLLESYSQDRIVDLLASESSRAERLRQSSPFFAVLTSSERDAVLSRLTEGR